MIYTSYYAKYRGNKGICVSNSQPRAARFKRCQELFPDWDKVDAYKNDRISWKDFRKAYIQKLKSLDVNLMAAQLDGCVLLCWEKDSSQCHRSIIREWFVRNGYACEEWED